MSERHHIRTPSAPYAEGATKNSGTLLVRISEDTARTLAGQHFAWMITNLTARLTDTIGTLVLDLPADVPLLGANIVPFSTHADFRSAILEGAETIRRTCSITTTPPSDIDVALGYGDVPLPPARRQLWASARRWTGALATTRTLLPADADPNPIGTYVAAALAAAETFKTVVHLDEQRADYIHELAINAYTLKQAPIQETAHLPEQENPAWRGADLGTVYVVGAGAVGNAVLHTLMALPHLSGLVALVDRADKPLKDTNLNRYLLAAPRDLPKKNKAQIVSENLQERTSFRIVPRNEGWGSLVSQRGAAPGGQDEAWTRLSRIEGEGRYENILSCVDRNRERHSIQDVLPRNLTQGSTHEFNAQARRYNLADPNGACAKCFHPPEAVEVDTDLRERLRGKSKVERARVSREAGLNPEDVERWLETGCEGLTGEALERLRLDMVGEEFSISFVSAMSGILLASEYVKERLGHPTLAGRSHIVRYYFLTNVLEAEPKTRDTSCSCLASGLREAYSMKWQS